MPEIAVIAPLTDISRGEEFESGSVPLHVTVLPNYTVSAEIDRVSAIVQQVAEGYEPFEVRAHSIDFFGPDGDIEVVTLERRSQLTRLHQSLVHGFSPFGAPVNPEYNGDGYQPHSTTQPHARLEIGETRVIDRLAVIDCTRPIRIITDVFLLMR